MKSKNLILVKKFEALDIDEVEEVINDYRGFTDFLEQFQIRNVLYNMISCSMYTIFNEDCDADNDPLEIRIYYNGTNFSAAVFRIVGSGVNILEDC